MWQKPSLGLLIGASLAGFGAWIDMLAILTMSAYVHQASAGLMALVSALFLVPSMLVGARVGQWVDRGNTRLIFVAALLLRSLVSGMLILEPSVWQFCGLILLRSALTIPVEPASNVLAKRIVSSSEIPRYFGVLGALRNVSKIAAPAIGAAMASRFGETSALMVSITLTVLGAFTVLFSIAAAGPLPNDGPSTPATMGRGGLAGTADPGTDEGANTPLKAQLIWTVVVFALMVFTVNNQLPVLLRDGGFDKALLGVLVSCSGAGGVMSALYMTKWNASFGTRNPLRATVVSVLAIALCFIGLGLAFQWPIPLASFASGCLFFCTGIFSTVEAIRSNTVIVQHFPGQVGAISATVQAYQSAAMLVAPWMAALIVQWVAMSTLFIGTGLFGVVALAAVRLRFKSAANAT